MTVTEEDVLTYLEHHGVKGQRWGVRRRRTAGGESKFQQRRRERGTLTGLTPKQEVILGGAIAAGTIFVARRMRAKNIQQMKVRDLENFRKRTDYIRQQELFKKARKVKYSGIRKGFEVSSKGVAQPLGTISRTRPSKVGFKVGARGVAEALHGEVNLADFG